MKTKEAVREEFLDYLRFMAQYWAHPDRDVKNVKERLDGFAHSILCAIDGVSADLPPLDLVIEADRDDSECEYEDGMVINDGCHLHDLYYKHKPDLIET